MISQQKVREMVPPGTASPQRDGEPPLGSRSPAGTEPPVPRVTQLSPTKHRPSLGIPVPCLILLPLLEAT